MSRSTIFSVLAAFFFVSPIRAEDPSIHTSLEDVTPSHAGVHVNAAAQLIDEKKTPLETNLGKYYAGVVRAFQKKTPDGAILTELTGGADKLADYLNLMQRMKFKGENPKSAFDAFNAEMVRLGTEKGMSPDDIAGYISMVNGVFKESNGVAEKIAAHFGTDDENAAVVDPETDVVDNDDPEDGNDDAVVSAAELRKKEMERARREAYYQSIDHTVPESPVGPTGVGDAKQEGGDHQNAVRHYEEAKRRGGDSSKLNSRLSRSYWHLGDYAKAHASAGIALRKNPQNSEAMSVFKLTRGRLRASDMKLPPAKVAERLDRARASDQKKARKAPFRFNPDTVERRILQEVATKKAQRYKQSRKLDKESRSTLKVGDRKKAIALLHRAIKIDPENAIAYANLAGVMTEGGNYAQALAIVENGLTSSPRSPALWTARALARNRSGNFEEALRDSSNAIQFQKTNAGGWFMRAFAKAGLRDRKASILDLEQAARLDHRFRSKLKQAKSMSEEADPLLLYDAMLAENRAAPKAPEAPRPPWVYLVFGLLAAGLAAMGLRLQPVRERFTTAFRRKGKTDTEAPTIEIRPDSGFWKGYRIEREIAAGGMGIVYEAVDTGLDRRVAIKCMRDEIKKDPRERERFLSEARLVAKLKHRNIVAINGIEEDGGDVYLVFEYVEGRTLYDALTERGKITLLEARDLFKEVCAALEFAHSKNVVHRDLKPANIMITIGGEVKVMDFGVARQAQEALEKLAMTNTVMGTPPYMSPEQEDGFVGKGADVYALGVCLYEALTGKQPFIGTYGAQLLKKKEGKFAPVSQIVDGLPVGIDDLLTDALNPDPLKRLATAKGFYDRLAAIAESASTPPPTARA